MDTVQLRQAGKKVYPVVRAQDIIGGSGTTPEGAPIDLSEYVTVTTFDEKFNQVNDGVVYALSELEKKANSADIVALIDLKADTSALVGAQDHLQGQISYNYNTMVDTDEAIKKDVAELKQSMDSMGTALGTSMQATLDSIQIEVDRKLAEVDEKLKLWEEKINELTEKSKE